MSYRTNPTRFEPGAALLAIALTVLAAAATVPAARAAEDPAAFATPLVLAYAQLPTPAPVQWAAVRYVPEPQAKPKPAGPRPQHQVRGVSQIHGGIYDPENVLGTRAVVGIRGGPMITRNLQVGLAFDWMYDSENLTTANTGINIPGGQPIAVTQVISRASLHQIPLMAYAQFEGWGKLWLVPYAGAGGGYQFMVITADDYPTNQHVSATLGGWTWQTWAGVGVPLGNRVRVTGEAFMLGGDVTRTKTDSVTGLAYRETARTNGIGARFGLAWGM